MIPRQAAFEGAVLDLRHAVVSVARSDMAQGDPQDRDEQPDPSATSQGIREKKQDDHSP